MRLSCPGEFQPDALRLPPAVSCASVPTPQFWEWQPLAAVNQPKRTLLTMEWTAHAPVSWHKSKTGRKNSPFYCDAKSVVGFVDKHVSFIPIYYDRYNAAYTQDPITSYDYQYSAK